MALEMVQTGYGKSLYAYAAHLKTESEASYDEWLAELTTELELACKDGEEEPLTDENSGADSEETEVYSGRKKEWEEQLEESIVVEVMLRQMLENGLGQREESQQENSKKNRPEELDNDFNLTGIPDMAEGKIKKDSEHMMMPGNSKFLQNNSGEGAEYWSQTNAGRQSRQSHIMCLTCETKCDRKKQWKILE